MHTPATAARSAAKRARIRAALLAVLLAPMASAVATAQEEGGAGDESPAAPLVLVCVDLGPSLPACRSGAAAFTEETGRAVRVVSADVEARSALERYRVLFSVASALPDVVQFPADWLPALEANLAAVDPPDHETYGAPAPARGGEGVAALPQYVGTPVMAVRRDVVEELPATWAALQRALSERSRLVESGSDILRGLVFPGEPDRSLVDVTLGVLLAAGAAPLVAEGTGRVRVGEATVIAAFSILNGLVGTVIGTDEPTLSERRAVGRFAEGRAAALVASSIHLPLVLDESVVGPFAAFGPIPRIEPDAAPGRPLLETWYLGVSRYAADREAATALARFLIDPDVQARAAVEHGLGPSAVSAWSDPEVNAARPWMARVEAMIADGVPAPVARFGAGWLRASEQVAAALRTMLAGGFTAEETAMRLQRELARIRRGAERNP